MTKILCNVCSRQGDLIAGEAHLPCGHQGSFYVPLNDKRTDKEIRAWDRIGPPLYYSKDCLKAVEVKDDGGNVTIKRPCGNCNCEVMAPRKGIAVGKGGASMATRATMSWWKLKALLTGRCA